MKFDGNVSSRVGFFGSIYKAASVTCRTKG
jgi:hypothetical protein